MPVETEIQQKAVLKALLAKPHTTTELRELNVLSPAPRILELREMGFDIETTRATFFDTAREPHTVGLYTLFESDELTARGEQLLTSIHKS